MKWKEKMNKKVIIVSTRPQRGGSIVLYELCDLLNELGIDAKIFLAEGGISAGRKKYFFWIKWFINIIKNPRKYFLNERKIRRKYLPFYNRNNTIVIYPEIVFGNVLFAKNVVRYYLYYDRYQAFDNAYGKNDLFICYRKQFNNHEKNPQEYELNIRSFDDNLYRQTNFGERSGVCYIFHKGKKRSDLPQKLDGLLLDDMNEESKVKILNECKYCYIYDTQTLYAQIAAWCGCIPIVVCEKGKNVDDYLKDGDTRFGIAYNDNKEEIDYAIKTRPQLIEEIKQTKKRNIEAVKMFIKLLKEKF